MDLVVEYSFGAIQQEGTAITSSSIPNINAKQTIIIAAVANGSTLTLYANHQQVASVQNSTYSQGQIGFAADSGSNVAFNNVNAWTF
jgi:hypothetical protein